MKLEQSFELNVKRFWTNKEEAIVKESYPNGGVLECMKLLPTRSRVSIQEKARSIGVKSNLTRKKNVQLESTDYIDAEIIAAYQSGKRHGISNLSEKLGRPRYWISRRAVLLGVAPHRFKESNWSDDELDILDTHSTKNPAVIQKHLKRAGYSRTENAIVMKRHRLDLETVDSDIFTTGQLGMMLGVSSKTISRWCDTEGLSHIGKEVRKITRQNFKNWLRDHVQQIDMRKIEPNKFWFFDMIFGK